MTLQTEKMIHKSLNIFHIRKPGAILQTILGCVTVTYTRLLLLAVTNQIKKNSIRDTRTPQPGEVIFNTMKYRSAEQVQRSRYFQSSVSYIKLQIMFM